jgi:TorA maturation chaperone TorD
MSCCFAHPDRELLELFDSARLEEFLRSWRYLGFGTSEEIGRITGWQKEFASHDAALRELQKEYTRLFVNACPRVVAPPYSSVYLGGQRRVWGSSMAKDFHDIPDHIAAELEFASYLIVQQCKRADNGTDDGKLADIENRFLANHLLRWAPAFLSLVIECSRTTFYQVVASLARQFVEWEEKRFSEHDQSKSNSAGA